MWASRFLARSPAAVGLVIRFLFIGSRLCSTLLSYPASRRRPCALLSLHLHQVVKRTSTSKLSIMLGTQANRGSDVASPARRFGLISVLLGAAGCGDCADGFVFRLQDDAIKWSRAHEASANYADPAQRKSAVRTALPGTSAIAAFEDHAGRVAGGQQALVGGIEAHRSDVLARQAVDDMLPGCAPITAMERALTSSNHDLVIRGNGSAANAYHVRWQTGQLPGHALVVRDQSAGTRSRHHRGTFLSHGNEVRLSQDRSTFPGFSLIGAGVDAAGCGCQPASGAEFQIVDPGVELRLLEGCLGDRFA